MRRSVPRTSCVITREAEGAAATCCTDVGLARCSTKAVAERAESANMVTEGEVGNETKGTPQKSTRVGCLCTRCCFTHSLPPRDYNTYMFARGIQSRGHGSEAQDA